MISFGFVSLDILIILILFIVLFLSSLKWGKNFLVALILSIYPTLLIFGSISTEKLNLTDQTAQAIIFLVLYILIIIILRKNITVKKLHGNSRKFLDYSLLSIVYIILLISVYINSVDYISSFYNFSGVTVNIVSKISYNVSLILPLLVILITNRKDKE